MVRITNNTNAVMDFEVKGEPKNGVPPTESLQPKETRNLNADVDTAKIRGRVASDAITIGEPARASASSSHATAKPKE